MARALGWLVIIAALAGAAAAGWIVGADVVATQPTDAEQLISDTASAGRLQVDIDAAAHPNDRLILGESRLAPFGNAEGLQGRQVISGRVVDVSEGQIILDTPTGRTIIGLTDETSFLLRMVRVDSSTIGAGAAVSVVLDDDGETAIAALALPAESRPSLNAPEPLGVGGGDPSANREDDDADDPDDGG